MLLHTIGIGHMCITQSDTFRYALFRYLITDYGFFGDGDGGCGGPSRLGYCKQLLLPTANVTHAMHASPAPAYICGSRGEKTYIILECNY